MTTVQRHTEFLDSPLIARNMGSSTFNPLACALGESPFYLMLPQDKLETLAPLTRLWIGDDLADDHSRQALGGQPGRVLPGRSGPSWSIKIVEDAVTLMRGMGIRLWFFFQSLHQLQECFGEKAKTILDNIDTQQYFAVNDFENAEALSKRIGEATIAVTSYGENASRTRQRGGTGQESGSDSSGWSTNVSDTGRRVFRPEELMVLPEDVALIFHRNVPVIPARLLQYYNHPGFRNGGTGEQPGLGKTAAEKSVALLLVSILFAVFAYSATAPSDEPSRFSDRQPEWWESNQSPPSPGRNPRIRLPGRVGEFPVDVWKGALRWRNKNKSRSAW